MEADIGYHSQSPSAPVSPQASLLSDGTLSCDRIIADPAGHLARRREIPLHSTRHDASALEEVLAQRIGPSRFKLWFEPRTLFTWNAGVLTVGVPNRYCEEWLQKTFHGDLVQSALEVYGEVTEVRYHIDGELFQAARREQAAAQVPALPRTATPTAGTVKPQPLPEPCKPKPPRPSPELEPTLFDNLPPPKSKRKRRWLRLSDFVVGPCNRVAHASALSVVEEPGEAVNPLLLHGPVGTGKTHLLEGVYAGLRKGRPDFRVCYVTSEDFTNRFVQARRQNKFDSFRKQFRECDALLVDDLHFLAGKRATQEEFLHTFDALLADGRQMVLTCDCHPRLADNFAPEVTDRLLGGAVWGLTPPDSETRLCILRAKAGQAKDGPLNEEVLEFIATQLRGNVRELEGAVHSVRHYAKVTGHKIDIGLVRAALADLLRHSVRLVKLPDVDGAVCTVLRLETGALQSTDRAWSMSHPRMVAMYLARKHTGASYSDIGGHFGGRNHSTAVAAGKRVRQWLQEDEELTVGERRLRVKEIVERVERELSR
jgi:chromosomal replication initiator protein